MKRSLRATLGRRTLARSRRGAELKRRSGRDQLENVVTLRPGQQATLFWAPRAVSHATKIRIRTTDRNVFVVGFRIGNMEQLADAATRARLPHLHLGAFRQARAFRLQGLPFEGQPIFPDICVTLVLESRASKYARCSASLTFTRMF